MVATPEWIVKSLIALLPVAAILCATVLMAPPPVVASPAQDKGAQAFATCRACHSLQAGAKSVLGPNLNKLFGRKAGSVPGFAYSPALKASNLVWDAKTLDQFIAAPTKKVPGTRMVMKIDDPAKRAALINYLKVETAK
jgi:cytochrome c